MKLAEDKWLAQGDSAGKGHSRNSSCGTRSECKSDTKHTKQFRDVGAGREGESKMAVVGFWRLAVAHFVSGPLLFIIDSNTHLPGIHRVPCYK